MPELRDVKEGRVPLILLAPGKKVMLGLLGLRAHFLALPGEET